MSVDINVNLNQAQIMGAIRGRRSYALKYLSPEAIDLGDIELMLEAANWAPSHGQTEPWRFTVFAGDGRQQLSDAFGEAYRLLTPEVVRRPELEQAQRDRVWQAPVWISIGMEPGLNERGGRRMPEWEEIIATGIAVQNAHLMASSLGLGAKWTSNTVATHSHVAQLVGLEPPARLLGFLYVGRPAVELLPGTRRPLADKVRWVTDAGDAAPSSR
ncbi:MAG TPA: nitroreductase [Chloroflexia bacterium]|nr:nitroreductase [Chloroflexia bacterium]